MTNMMMVLIGKADMKEKIGNVSNTGKGPKTLQQK